MPQGDDIPTLASLRAARTRPRSFAPKHSAPQLAFDLTPPAEPPQAELPKAEPPRPVLRAEPTIYTVRRLLNELRLHVEQAYTGLLTLEGEISNCRPASSGHLYLTLKDGEAQLPVVLFRRHAALLPFRPKDGMQVEVRGRISVYETRGQLQLIAETMRPRGEGALQLAFEQLKRRLAAEGLFDPAKKRPLPPFPHCIGIVTSPNGAALRDIIQVTRRRHARLNLLIYPAVMQGSHCPSTVAAGVRWFNQNPNRVDLILVARGGGSIEDLAGFNDETLARVIAASQLPVVSAIGHEIDTTIADLVSDLRAPTPSAAAELITAAQHRIEERVAALERRNLRAIQFHLMHSRQRLSRLSAQQVLARVRDAVSLRHQRSDELRFRLQAAIARRNTRLATRLTALETRLRRQDPGVRLADSHRRLQVATARLQSLAQSLTASRRSRVHHAAARLQALSPVAVLQRGYAIVYTDSGSNAGSILRDAARTQPGDQIRARLAHGTITARITAATVPASSKETPENP
jgi:exodeoxyribonuclease VII large subunit